MGSTIRRSISIALLVATVGLAHGQVMLGVDGGFSVANQYGSQLNLLPQGKFGPVAGLALEYARFSNCYLRSGLNYHVLGGKDTQNAPFSSKKGGRQANESFNMLQLNTVVRTAYRVGIAELFLGFGPKVDFLMGKAVFKDRLFSGYKVKPVLFGLRYEVGLDFWLANESFKLGILSLFEQDLSAFAKSKGNTLYNLNYSLQLNLGFRIGGKSGSPAATAE